MNELYTGGPQRPLELEGSKLELHSLRPIIPTKATRVQAANAQKSPRPKMQISGERTSNFGQDSLGRVWVRYEREREGSGDFTVLPFSSAPAAKFTFLARKGETKNVNESFFFVDLGRAKNPRRPRTPPQLARRWDNSRNARPEGHESSRESLTVRNLSVI